MVAETISPLDAAAVLANRLFATNARDDLRGRAPRERSAPLRLTVDVA